MTSELPTSPDGTPVSLDDLARFVEKMQSLGAMTIKLGSFAVHFTPQTSNELSAEQYAELQRQSAEALMFHSSS